MRLIDAVNLILPKLGEHPVTNLEQPHPTLAVLLPEIQNTLKRVLLKGWWFNEFPYVALRSSDDTITLGAEVISFVPMRVQAALRGRKLWNLREGTDKWAQDVHGTAKISVPFDELPECAAQHVMYTALVTAYGTDLGLSADIQLWISEAQSTYSELFGEHLTQKRYNTKQSSTWQRVDSARRGIPW